MSSDGQSRGRCHGPVRILALGLPDVVFQVHAPDVFVRPVLITQRKPSGSHHH